MPLTIIDANSIGPGTRLETDVSDTDVLVLENVIVAGLDGLFSFGITLLGSDHDVEVRGRVSGSVGIQLGNPSADTTGNALTVAAGGVVSGSHTGVQLMGASRLVNAGEIYGVGYGAFVSLPSSAGVTIENSGTIVGLEYGLMISSSPASGAFTVVTNTGTIQGGTSGSYFGMDVDDALTNRGLMIGDVDLNTGDDALDNRGGTIRGRVFLGDGNDTFENRGGTVTGTIDGGGGYDTFRVGFSAEVIDGGDDFDVLDLSAAARGLTVSLADASLNTREAKGDSYTGIEIIFGSRFADTLIGDDGENLLDGGSGDDRLQGGGGEDQLVGGAGRDRIDGGEGDDLLIGGTGRDVLRGGAGNDHLFGQVGRDVLRGGAGDDTFWFTSPRYGAARIADWGSTTGDDDHIHVSTDEFGGGLVGDSILDATQFTVRANSNAARDADDRFIFRSSDATLWFDEDGKGGKGPVLVADLQQGAVLTADDIWLV